jgi:hypothetical protein
MRDHPGLNSSTEQFLSRRTRYLRNAMLSARLAESQPGMSRIRHGSLCAKGGAFLRKTRIRTHICFTVLVLLMARTSAWAQSASPNDQETISLLVRQVKELQNETLELREKVNALQAERVSAPVDAGVVSGAAVQLQAVSPAGAESRPESNAALHEAHGIQWSGFGEVDYKVLNQRQPELGTYGFIPGSAGNFYTGDFDLFVHSRLTEKASLAADIVFEEIDAQSYKLDMRQALLKYDVNDHLKLSVGRYQTGIGYYNSAYRSAAWLQTTADRPLVMEYASNGGLLPTQAVGVSLTGAIPSGKLGLNYIAQYGSSDTIRPDIDGSGLLNDDNDGNHVLLGAFARPDWVPGLQLGASFFHDKISDTHKGQNERYGQTILDAHVVYLRHGLEFLNEGLLIRHSELHGPDLFNMPAFYTQLSKRVGHFRPFVRYQYVNTNSQSVFEDVLLRHGPSFGARYDLNDYIAFKAQLDHTLRKGQPDLNGLQLQFAFSF